MTCQVGVSYIEVDRPPGQEVLHTLEAECNKVGGLLVRWDLWRFMFL